MKIKLLTVLLIGWGVLAVAQETWFFREGTDVSFYDQGIVNLGNLGDSQFEHTHPPGLTQYNDKVPCSTRAYTGNTSLQFNYTSSETGNWQVTIYRNDWSVTDISAMDSISFYLYSDEALPSLALPQIGVKANNKSGVGDLNSQLYELGSYNQDIAAGRWTKIKFPIQVLMADADNSELNFKEVKGIIFNQSELNGVARLLLVDELSTFKSLDAIPVVENVIATGYDSHAELRWEHPLHGMSYQIDASFDNQETYQPRTTTEETFFLDFIPQQYRNSTIHYRIVAAISDKTSQPVEKSVEIRDFTDDELMDMVQRYSFRYFWEGAHTGSGMAMERSHVGGSTVASGATGMGLMAMIVAYERSFEDREEIKDRVLKILNALETCERHHGAWSHWYNGDTYQTQPFTPDDDGGDIVETSFVAQGLLAVRNYFSGADNKSVQIREKSTQLWEGIEWDWYRNGDQNLLFWHWSPNIQFTKNMKVTGWNEALVTYIMAASSPTYSIPNEVYQQGWARNGDMVNRRVFYTHEIYLSPNWGGPLFWLHYSHLGINPKGLTDQYADYWQECINTVKIHHAYAIENPLNHEGYSDQCWGLTASDDPFGYTAHAPMNNDNGTISPTAALASMPYAPEESLKALKYFYRQRGSELFGEYGPYDAFNDKYNWVKESYIGIDQGPIVIMIENHRSGLLWNTVMKDADLQSGLDLLGFQYETTTSTQPIRGSEEMTLYPNPARDRVNITLPDNHPNQSVRVRIFSLNGHMVLSQQLSPTKSAFVVNITGLPDGLYLTNVQYGTQQYNTKLIIQKH